MNTRRFISEEQSIALKILFFLLTVMVVLRHSMNLHLFYPGGHAWYPVTDVNIAVQRFCTEFTHAAVPGFFLISGFLFFGNIEVFSDIKTKFKTRIRSLLIPFLSWNAVMLVFWTMLSLVPALYPQMVKTFGVEYSLGWFLSKLTFHPIVGQFWYIRTLFIFICLSPLIYLTLRFRYISMLIIYWLIVSWRPVDTRILSTEGAVFFCIGGYLSKYVGLPEKLRFRQWISLVPVSILLILQAIFQWIPIQIPFGVNLGVTLLLLWQLCLYLVECPHTKRMLLNLGNHSFFIYALHGSIISGLSVLIARIIPHTTCFSALVFWGGFLTTVLLSLGVSWIIKRFCPKVYSVFSGGR